MGSSRKPFNNTRATDGNTLGVSETTCGADGSSVHNQRQHVVRLMRHFKTIWLAFSYSDKCTVDCYMFIFWNKKLWSLSNRLQRPFPSSLWCWGNESGHKATSFTLEGLVFLEIVTASRVEQTVVPVSRTACVVIMHSHARWSTGVFSTHKGPTGNPWLLHQ